MPPLASIDGVLWLLNFVLSAALIGRIAQLSLVRRFPSFFILLVFALLRTVILIPFVKNKMMYARLWIGTELIALLLFTLSTLEIYTQVLSRYPGVHSLGRWVTLSGLSLGLVLALATSSMHMSESGQIVTLGLVLTIDRGVYFGLTAVILLMSLFLIWFPVPTPRNMVVHSFVFATYFLSKAFIILVRTIRGDDLHHAFSMVLLALGIGCLCVWTALLRREEEDPAVTFGRRWNPEEETRLIRQLRAINSSLGRLSRD